MRYTLSLLLLAFAVSSNAQTDTKNQSIDLGIFSDASNHWYAIPDKGTVIFPRPGHPRYTANDVAAIADNILLYQKDNGGWPKNYDMQAILTSEQKDSLVKDKHVLNTTFDNRSTYSHIACLANIYTVTKIEKYKEAALKGLDFILSAQ